MSNHPLRVKNMKKLWIIIIIVAVVVFAIVHIVGHTRREQREIKIVSLSPSTVKKFICSNGWAGKKDVARAIVSKFPELKAYLTQDRVWKERFHQNMFDAVALGIIAQSQNKRRPISADVEQVSSAAISLSPRALR
jgi:Holliday junction resolvasome RuvABC endonuclease subunit